MTAATRRMLAVASIGVLLAAGLIWSFWPRAAAVDAGSVTRGPLSVEVADEGRTRVREIYQLSAPVNGRLLRVEVHAGDVVAGGRTVVARLLPIAPAFLDVRTRAQAESTVKSADAAKSLATAEVTRARAELAFAESELRRARNLIATVAISRASFDRARLARDTAAAQVETARAALRAREFDLETAKALLMDPAGADVRQNGIPLLAPVSGRILRVEHESEAVLAAGTPILAIGDRAKLEVVAEFVSEDAVRVRSGDQARITDWGGTPPLTARVRLVEPSGFTKVSALGIEEQRVNILLDPAPPLAPWTGLGDAFRVIARITVWKSPNVLRVPVAALFRGETGWAVYAVHQGRARLTPVRIGHTSDEAAEVLEGLSAGDLVILHPSDRIGEGTRVAASVQPRKGR